MININCMKEYHYVKTDIQEDSELYKVLTSDNEYIGIKEKIFFYSSQFIAGTYILSNKTLDFLINSFFPKPQHPNLRDRE